MAANEVLPPYSPFAPIQLSDDALKIIHEAATSFVESSFSSWAKLGPHAKTWKLCPQSKQPHLVAKQTMQLGDFCLRVQHATLPSAERFKNSLVKLVEEFRRRSQDELINHPRIAGCKAYVAIEKAAKQKRLVTFIVLSLSDLKNPSNWIPTLRDIQHRTLRLCNSWVGNSVVQLDIPHGVRLGTADVLDPQSMLLMHTIMNCAGKTVAQAWSHAQAAKPEDRNTNPTLRDYCIHHCAAELRREWEWALLSKQPNRQQRCYPAKTSNFRMPDSSYADAVRRPATTHPKGDSSKVDRGKVQQPALQTKRPVDIPPRDSPISEGQQRQDADTMLTMKKDLQLLQERVASLESKLDELVAILRRREQPAPGPDVPQQREETAIARKKPANPARESWFSPRNCLTPKSKRATGRAPAAAAGAGGGAATASTAVVVAGPSAGSPVTPPAKRQSKGTAKSR